MKVGSLIQDKENYDVGIIVEIHDIGSAPHRKIPSVSILWASSGSILEEEIDEEFLEVISESR